MTPSICIDMPIGTTGKLIDSRNNIEYSVAKLRDSMCWMTQNLNIIDKTISNIDSDMASGSFTIPASSKSGFTSSDQNSPKAYYEAQYGGYYNWYTATAGTGNASITASGANTPSSICPKGWRLPTGGSEGLGSFGDLLSGISAQEITRLPYNFVYGGLVRSSSLDGAGSGGYYWSSTANSASAVYSLNFSSSVVNPSSYLDRSLGNSVRCVAR